MKKLLFPIVMSVATVFSAAAIKPDQMKWFPADTLPVLGTLAPDASKPYSRFPDSMKDSVRPDLWSLSLNSAGLAIRFRSDATALAFTWKAMNRFNMNHMTPTGIRGLDLYAMEKDGTWRTVSSVRPSLNSHTSTSVAVSDMTRRMREYMLYLPLYDGVDSIMIGVDSAAVVLQPKLPLPQRQKPVIMYGTSILQGGCASRPGMVHTSILGRKLNREVINLGFSGNAKLDYQVAELIAQADPSLIVLDMLPNCKKEELEERLEKFYSIIRKSHPSVPIILIESPIFPVMHWNMETLATITEKNGTLKTLYDGLKATDDNLHYVKGEDILTDPEGTVDNYHFTDLGFTEFAGHLLPLMHKLLEGVQ